MMANSEFGYKLYRYNGFPYSVDEHNIAQALTLGHIEADISNWFSDLAMTDHDLAESLGKLWQSRNIKEAAKSLVLLSRNKFTSLPPALVEGSDERIAFARLPFVIRPISKCDFEANAPITAELLARMDKPGRFAAWVAQCVTGRNRKQTLWLWGDANAYKSTYIEKVLGYWFKAAYCNVQSAHFDPTFQWLEQQLEGKRLVQCDEAIPDLIEHSKFKMLTGSTQVYANVKYADTKTISLECHFAFTSNQPPSVRQETALKVRVLPVRITGLSTTGISYKDHIDAYRDEFQWLCCYGAQCILDGATNHLDDLEQMGLAANKQMDVEEIFHNYFIANENGYVEASDVSRILEMHGYHTLRQKGTVISAWNSIVPVIDKKKTNASKCRIRCYCGISLK